jgi:hypothetical protein
MKTIAGKWRFVAIALLILALGLMLGCEDKAESVAAVMPELDESSDETAQVEFGDIVTEEPNDSAPGPQVLAESSGPDPVQVTVKVTDSYGSGIPGVTIRYGSGGSYTTWYFPGSPTGGDGTLTADLAPGTYSFQALYNNGHAEHFNVDVSGPDPVTVLFGTSRLTLRLEECDTGNGIDGGKARFGAGSSYWTTWVPGLTGSSGTTGENGIELFSGAYTFQMMYKGTAEIKPVNMPDSNHKETWQASKVTLTYGGTISYGGSGDATYFSKPTMYLLPGTYKFHFRPYRIVDLTIGPCSTEKTVVTLKLNDHTGAPMNGGTARGGVGSSYSTWHVPGQTGDDGDGVLLDMRDGLYTNMSYEMKYNNTAEHKTQDVSVNSVFEFETQLITLRLETCQGVGLPGGNPRYGVGGTYTTSWFPGGVTGPDGETTAEFFPGEYSFQMQYQGTADEIMNHKFPDDGTTLTWQTTNLMLNYSGQISYGGSSGDSRWFSKPSMELLPGTYKFHFRGLGRADVSIGGCTLNLAPVKVRLHNDGVELTDPKYYLEVAGVGNVYNGDVVVTDKPTWQLRARADSIAGPWFYWNTANTILDYEFATVHVTLHNDGVELGADYQVEVSGVGTLTTCDTFHVPPNTSIQYRLRTATIAGPWQYAKFDPGKTEWALEFATVHVTLHNDGDILGADYQVEVSGVGTLTTCDTFHVPPNTSIQYRLRTATISGPWQYAKFDPGKTEWALEFATVTVRLVEAEKVEISGVGSLVNGQTFHVPPNTSIQYRLYIGGSAGPWKYKSFTAGYQAWTP